MPPTDRGPRAAPTISVALASFQGERWIGEQLRSILGQTRPPDQLVIADDGSTDGTLDAIAAALAAGEGTDGARAPRVDVLRHGRTLGVADNFAAALQACTGSLVVLSDQDDVWAADRIAAAAARFAERPHLLLLHSDAELVDGAGAPLGSSLFERLEIGPTTLAAIHRGDGFRLLLRRNVVTGATVMMRRELLDAALPVPDGWLHDEWLAIVAAALDGLDVDESRPIRYRQHDDNQVGVAAPTLRRKLGRLAAPRADRNARLLLRSRSLAARLADVAGVPDARLRDVAAKLRHEQRRAGLPASRIARIPRIVAGVLDGGYRRFGRGPQDAVRDLIQSAD